MKLTLRHELKHFINYSDYLAIRSRLRVTVRADSNGGAEGIYKIRIFRKRNVFSSDGYDSCLILEFDLGLGIFFVYKTTFNGVMYIS